MSRINDDKMDEKLLNLAKIIGSNLRERIRAKDISCKKFAKNIGISQMHLSFMINGRRLPSWEMIYRLSDSLGCNIFDLLKGENMKTSDINLVSKIFGLIKSGEIT